MVRCARAGLSHHTGTISLGAGHRFGQVLMLAFFVGAFYLIHRVTEQIWDSRIVSITVIVAILSCVVAIAFLAIRKSHQAMKI